MHIEVSQGSVFGLLVFSGLQINDIGKLKIMESLKLFFKKIKINEIVFKF